MSEIHDQPWYKTRGVQITLKLAMVFFLTLFLLIPKFAIIDLIEERQRFYDQVNVDVSKGWGGQQVVSAPVLAIPYTVTTLTEQKNYVTDDRLLVISANQCNVEADLTTTSKQKSIYEVLLYKSAQSIKGNFSLSGLDGPDMPKTLQLSKAFIAMGVNDLKGLDSKVDFVVNGQKIPSQAGMNGFSFSYGYKDDGMIIAATDYSNGGQQSYSASLKHGLHILYPLDMSKKTIDFDIALTIKGGQKLSFIPNALNFKTHMVSAYPHPGFNGEYLPEHKTTEKGFDATWNLLEYNKNLPHFNLTDGDLSIDDGSFSINVKPLQNHYSSTLRAGKYMALVIILTFLVIFLTELIQKHRIHIFQYTLIGLAIAIFFILLLSFSEVVGFTKAYMIATVATAGLTFMYSKSVFHNIKSAMLVLGLQLLIYGFIYTILRMEETSLLFGSIGLFVILAATMYFTRQINWYESAALAKESNNDQNIIE